MAEKEDLQRRIEQLEKRNQQLAVWLAALIQQVGNPVTISTRQGIYIGLPVKFDIEQTSDERGNWILTLKDKT